MQQNKIRYTPFVKAKDSLWEVMSDVLFSLIPIVVFAYLAYGEMTLFLLFVAIVSAIAAEFIFASVFLNNRKTLLDGSAIVTAVLLVFTLAPFTPWYVVAFGAAAAIIFGKILWGGVGHNLFNPALVGREFMTVFFPAIMTSSSIWYNKEYINFKNFDLFGIFGDSAFIQYLNTLFFKPSGAIGEYSVLFLVFGGIFLLLRRRISWHIPFGLLVTFFILLQIFSYEDIKFSIAGVLLGTIYMATDMPSSASTKSGKVFYGALIGAVAILLLLNDIKHEYMSYSILIVNGFSLFINKIFQPRVWAGKLNLVNNTGLALLLTIVVLSITYLISVLHHADLIKYIIFVYIIFIIIRFTQFTTKKTLK